MIGLHPKRFFFDTKFVRRRVKDSTRRVLSKFGAYVRRTARQSIRKRKKKSLPGSPPSSHIGLLKRFIWFGYEPNKRSVVIGPARLTQNNRGEAPERLEHGGFLPPRNPKRSRRRIKARPYMTPAFEKETNELPSLWHDSIR